MIKGRIVRLRLANMANPIRAIETCACSDADNGTTMAEYRNGNMVTRHTPMTIIHFRNDWESGFAMAGSIKSVQSIERRLTAEKKDRNYPSGTLQATKND